MKNVNQVSLVRREQRGGGGGENAFKALNGHSWYCYRTYEKGKNFRKGGAISGKFNGRQCQLNFARVVQHSQTDEEYTKNIFSVTVACVWARTL